MLLYFDPNIYSWEFMRAPSSYGALFEGALLESGNAKGSHLVVRVPHF